MIVSILQIIVAVFLICVIMLQSRGEATGTFGAQAQTYRSKKGLEKFLFYITIAIAVFFASVSIITVIL